MVRVDTSSDRYAYRLRDRKAPEMNQRQTYRICPTAPPFRVQMPHVTPPIVDDRFRQTIENPDDPEQNIDMAKKTTAEVAKAMDIEEEYKPRLTVNVDQLPDIKDWEVGETYTLEIKGKMVSKSQGGWNGKQPLEATFTVENAKTDTEYDDD